MKNLKIIASAVALSWLLVFFRPAIPAPKNTLVDKTLSVKSMSLDKRYNNSFVNTVFKDNILLTLRYLNGEVAKGSKIDWGKIDQPYSYTLEIKPDSVFAFHDGVLPEFKDQVTQTTNAHFNASEGFKSDGYLFGDGVCHLASLINWVAKDAGLEVTAPVNHNFANIPEIPKEYGVSIYSQEKPTQVNLMQNLYIKNSLKKPVVFKFNYDGKNLKIAVIKKV